MKHVIRNTAGKFLFKALSAAWAASLPLDAAAQPTPAELDELVEYSQCIRDNGYPEFPDPTPQGLQFRITPGSVDKFEAAQRACTSELPAGLAAMNEPPTADTLEAMVDFAECVRANGVADFPDPGPDGTFAVGRSVDLRTPQAQAALQRCRESNPAGATRLRVGG